MGPISVEFEVVDSLAAPDELEGNINSDRPSSGLVATWVGALYRTNETLVAGLSPIIGRWVS